MFKRALGVEINKYFTKFKAAWLESCIPGLKYYPIETIEFWELTRVG